MSALKKKGKQELLSLPSAIETPLVASQPRPGPDEHSILPASPKSHPGCDKAELGKEAAGILQRCLLAFFQTSSLEKQPFSLGQHIFLK